MSGEGGIPDMRARIAALEGGALRYDHVQSGASALWTINHNLGVKPAAVSVLSIGGVEVNAEVTHISVNQLTIGFAAPYAGTARIL